MTDFFNIFSFLSWRVKEEGLKHLDPTRLCFAPSCPLKGFPCSSVEFQASEPASPCPVGQGRGCGVIPGEGLAPGEGAE